MIDEDFLKRKEIRIYKRVVIGAAITGIVFMVAVLVQAFL